LRWIITLFLGLTIVSFRARADDVFGIDVQPAGGAAIRSSGANLLSQLQDLIENEGLFNELNGRAFTASLRYGEVGDALRITRNASGTSATVASRLSGLNQTFNASSPSQLRRQIEDFLKKSGGGEFAGFLRAIDRQSVLGVIDGNPHAATAVIAQDAFRRWGVSAQEEMSDTGTGFDLRLDGGYGHIDTRGFSGTYYDASLSLGWQFSRPVGIVLDVPFETRDLGGSTSYIVGANLGLPITLVPSSGDGIGWRVTPFGSTFGAYSGDLVSGGLSAGGGVVSAVQLRSGRLEFTIANEAAYTGGVPLSVRDVDIKTDVDQWLFKNGVAATYAITNALFVDAGVAYSNYLRAAAVPAWWTATAGLNLRFGDRSGIWAGYRGEFANGYNTNGATAALYFRF
jgi:hypothetical protein